MILNGIFPSKALGAETAVSVLTPPDYQPGRKYKAVYLLHGLFGGNADFLNYTMLPVYGRGYGAIFIMPEVNRSFYSDQKNGQKYLTYVGSELPEAMGSYFNLSDKREDTAVIGISMGGYGALKAAFTYPERFGMCGAASSCCLDLYEFMQNVKNKSDGLKWAKSTIGEQMYSDFCAIFGEKLDYDEKQDVSFLAKAAAEKSVKPRVLTVCGKNDYMYRQNAVYAEYLKTLALDTEHIEIDGEHNWNYFNAALQIMLDYYYGEKR